MRGHQGDVLLRGQMRKQTAVLNHVPHAAAQGDQVLRRDGRTVHENRAGRGFDQADEQAQEGRLAAPARPQEGRHLIALHGQVGGLNGITRPIFFTHAFKFDHG